MDRNKIGQVEFRPFQKDYDRVAALINETWLDKWQGSMMFEYSPEFLRWNFEGPRTDPDFVQEVYSDGQFAGFYAGLYRRFSLSGRLVVTSLESFLAGVKGVRPVLPLYVARRDAELLREKGYAACLQVFDQAFSNLEMMELLARKQKVKVEEVADLDWRYKVFDVGRLAACEPLGAVERLVLRLKHRVPAPGPLAANVRPYKETDLEACLELMNGIEQRAPKPYLVRRWDAAELAWQLHYPGVADTLVYERDGRAAGLVNSYRITCVHRTREQGTVVDHLCFGDLTGRQRRALMLAALQRFAADGSIMAGVVDSVLLDRPALRRAGFLKARRPVKLIAGVVDPSVSFRDIRNCWVDIR